MSNIYHQDAGNEVTEEEAELATSLMTLIDDLDAFGLNQLQSHGQNGNISLDSHTTSNRPSFLRQLSSSATTQSNHDPCSGEPLVKSNVIGEGNEFDVGLSAFHGYNGGGGLCRGSNRYGAGAIDVNTLRWNEGVRNGPNRGDKVAVPAVSPDKIAGGNRGGKGIRPGVQTAWHKQGKGWDYSARVNNEQDWPSQAHTNGGWEGMEWNEHNQMGREIGADLVVGDGVENNRQLVDVQECGMAGDMVVEEDRNAMDKQLINNFKLYQQYSDDYDEMIDQLLTYDDIEDLDTYYLEDGDVEEESAVVPHQADTAQRMDKDERYAWLLDRSRMVDTLFTYPHSWLMCDKLTTLLTRQQDDLQERPNRNLASDIPERVDYYHSLVAKDSIYPPDRPSLTFGKMTSVYKAKDSRDGLYYTLLRFHEFRLRAAKECVTQWKEILLHPNLVNLYDVFTTETFHDHSVIFVYDYVPLAQTAYQSLFSDSERRQYLHTLTSPDMANKVSIGDSSTNSLLPEYLLWSTCIQLTSALRHIHVNGLAHRALDLTKVLLNLEEWRWRLNCSGVFDILFHKQSSVTAAITTATTSSSSSSPSSSSSALSHHHFYHHHHPELTKKYQVEDVRCLGRILLCLACRSLYAAYQHNWGDAMQLISMHYSKELKELITFILVEDNVSINDIMPMIGPKFYMEIDAQLSQYKYLRLELRESLKLDVVLRLVMQLMMICERPQHKGDTSWSETGERYLLKLFRDFIFHHTQRGVKASSMGWVIHHVLELESGSQQQVPLVSRDGQNVLITTYSHLRQALRTAFHELRTHMTERCQRAERRHREQMMNRQRLRKTKIMQGAKMQVQARQQHYQSTLVGYPRMRPQKPELGGPNYHGAPATTSSHFYQKPDIGSNYNGTTTPQQSHFYQESNQQQPSSFPYQQDVSKTGSQQQQLKNMLTQPMASRSPQRQPPPGTNRYNTSIHQYYQQETQAPRQPSQPTNQQQLVEEQHHQSRLHRFYMQPQQAADVGVEEVGESSSYTFGGTGMDEWQFSS